MVNRININGIIVSNEYKEVYEEFGITSVCPNDVISQLPQNNSEPVEIHVSSDGGDVYAGFEIYTKLKEYKGRITAKVINLAASAATLPLMAADEILISPVAQIMIHNAWGTQTGNQHAMKDAAKQLEEIAESLINAYELRTKQRREKLQKWMDEETYFSAYKAVQYGFADEVLYTSNRTQSKVIAACVGADGLLNQVVIDEYFANKEKKDEPKRRSGFDMLRAKHNPQKNTKKTIKRFF